MTGEEKQWCHLCSTGVKQFYTKADRAVNVDDVDQKN